MKELKKLKIDPELRDLLPPLTSEEKKQLEKSILENGYVGIPIFTWNDFIVDGHNRYEICWEHNVPFDLTVLGFDTKEEVIEWMLDIQLGRRNLTPIQRIAITEKYRPIYEKQAKENMSAGGGDKKSGSQNSSTPKIEKIDVRNKLAETAGVSTDTYSKGSKILNSNNEEVKQKVLSGEMSINAGYNAIKPQKSKEEQKDITNGKEVKSETKTVEQDNIKEIIADMKIPKNADDYWNFMNEVECIQENFEDPIEAAFDILFERHDINGRVTEEERDIAIDCIQDVINKLQELKNKIENIKLKGER